jgi:hypothetical protein
LFQDQPQEAGGDEPRPRPELVQRAPPRDVALAVVVDLDLVELGDAVICELDVVDEVQLVTRLAVPLEDVLERAEVAHRAGVGADLLEELAADRILARLAELDSAGERHRDDLARLRIQVVPDEETVAVADDGGCDHADLSGGTVRDPSHRAP